MTQTLKFTKEIFVIKQSKLFSDAKITSERHLPTFVRNRFVEFRNFASPITLFLQWMTTLTSYTKKKGFKKQAITDPWW